MRNTGEMDYRKLALWGAISLAGCWLTTIYVVGPSPLSPLPKRLLLAPFLLGIGFSLTALIAGVLLWFMRWRAGD